jgi:hypothetical protein
VEHEPIAVVVDDAVREYPAHTAAVRAPELDDVAGAHTARV